VTTPPEPVWVSVRTAARRLARTERHVWALLRAEKLDSKFTDDKHRLVNAAAIEARAKIQNRKRTEPRPELQWELQSESIYDRVVRLEKQMRIVLQELRNGR
jgi:hypothetical protein